MARNAFVLVAFGLITACLIARNAGAAQFESLADVSGSADGGFSYIGPSDGGFADFRGTSDDGGRDAFDSYGLYLQLDGLTLSRRTELLIAQNTFRFVDTFTNATSATITTTLDFFGNLGSNKDLRTISNSNGVLLSCPDSQSQPSGCDFAGAPVIAHVAGNAGLAVQSLTASEIYNASFAVSVAPSQSVILLNFAFLASNLDGTDDQDITLAGEMGQLFRSTPDLAGLTALERSQIINFNLGGPPGPTPVPEPASLALLGSLIMGAGLFRHVVLRNRPEPV